MKVEEFLELMKRIKWAKDKLDKMDLEEDYKQLVLKIFISEITDKINLNMLQII